MSASGAKNAALSYDPLGRLWQVSGSSGAVRFLYDGDYGMDFGVRNAIRHGYGFGDNPGDSEAIMSGYDAR